VSRVVLLAGEFADSGSLIAGVDGNGNRDGAGENSAGGGFVEPGTFRLCLADDGREEREAEQKDGSVSHR
jgi:hypothetical protein